MDERTLELDPVVLQKNWFFLKKKTSEKALAFVAIDVLGMVITSVATERSFSRGRIIIYDQRTKISPEHANDKMIIQLNKSSVLTAIERRNIFNH